MTDMEGERSQDGGGLGQAELPGRSYSHRLGVITPRQFQAALQRLGLGDFMAATPVAGGLFGQNVFVTSTSGDYVLRGCPHYPWQFPKECLGATLLHEHTQVPVAYPYLMDTSTDIFGWPYIVMPRLQGIHPLDETLAYPQLLDIACAMGRNLAQMQALTWGFAGEYDLTSNTIQPFAGGFSCWVIDDVRRWLAKAHDHGLSITDGDVSWVLGVIDEAESALEIDFQPCFVMNDYNPGNVVVDCLNGEWRVTGLFDLMEYYFGDGEADLARLMARYLDLGKGEDTGLAEAFGGTYLAHRSIRPGFVERFAIFMLRDRLIVYEYGTRPGLGWFPDRSFRDYAESYVRSYRVLEPYIR